jgi:glycosyltransferase involved in cell wall biosynthesis
LSENFGHVMVEALSAGCPLIISDRTPWRDLETKHIGWDLPLDSLKWKETLNRAIEMEADEYETMSKAAREFAVRWLNDEAMEQATADLLTRAAGR